jgi:hypothetical protein
VVSAPSDTTATGFPRSPSAALQITVMSPATVSSSRPFTSRTQSVATDVVIFFAVIRTSPLGASSAMSPAE